MTSTSITPPIRLARRARHRKPNRRGRWIKRGASVFTVSLILGAVLQLTGTLPAHAGTIASPADEAAACTAVYHMHHEDVLRDAGQAQHDAWERAWLHAWHTARYADPEMRADIHHWLRTRRGWSLVQYTCYPDQ